ncbi:MAG: Flagellar hook-length control protein FliK [bacterium]|nr:Flagellar hook-length control protein FliK [bacterium]
MIVRRAVLGLVAAVAACQFSIKPDVDASVAADDLGVDLAGVAGDLARPAPDGAVPRGLGFPCDGVAECDSGACVDGYCCESLCDPGDASNLCKACNVPGHEGRCVAAVAGTDPHQQCEPDPVATCGKDGLCDGHGACRRYPHGTACGMPSCAAGSLTAAATCDGEGSCVAGAVRTCAPYVCGSATSCATSCTPPDVGCAPPATCNNGSCGKHALGQQCASPSDCASNFCSPQAVCCDAACTGSCESCALGGQPAGHCAPLAAGTQCAAAACMGDSRLAARTCDGNRTCQAAATTDCTPYTCNTANATCFAKPCQGNQQCAAGHTCNGGSGKCQ